MNSLKAYTFKQIGKLIRTNPYTMRVALKCLPDKNIIITIDGIGSFEINYRKNRSLWLRNPVKHESFPLSFLKKLINHDSVVYDVGSNIGLYARYELDCFRASQVIAFEPMDANRALLEKNISLSANAGNAIVTPYAVADFDGESELQVDDMQTATAALDVVTHGQASYGRRQLGLAPLTQKVQCRKLDTLVFSEGLPAPNVIKIDVEGAENLVLAGAGRCLNELKPDLVVELHGADKARIVCSMLLDNGYYLAGCRNESLEYIDSNCIEGITENNTIDYVMAVSDKDRLIDKYEPFNPF